MDWRTAKEDFLIGRWRITKEDGKTGQWSLEDWREEERPRRIDILEVRGLPKEA
jgi:hypothetical protein